MGGTSIISVLSLIILISTIGTFIFAIGSYIKFRIGSNKKTTKTYINITPKPINKPLGQSYITTTETTEAPRVTLNDRYKVINDQYIDNEILKKIKAHTNAKTRWR